MIDIEGYLTSKSLTYKRNPTQIYLQCFFCDESLKGTNKPGRLYINNTGTDRHGLYHCKLCDAKGTFAAIQKHFGDESESYANSGVIQKVTHRAAQIYHRNLRDEDRVWLREARGLTDETIISRGLGYAPGRTWLYDQLKNEFDLADILASGLVKQYSEGVYRDSFSNGITIPYFAGNLCVVLRYRNLDGEGPKYMSSSGADSRLFNVNTTWGADELVICEGEFDAILMEQLGYRAVGMPGAATWGSSWNSYTEDATRVWIVCDPDPAGIQGADKVEAAVGAKAKIVSLPVPNGIDPNKIDPSYLVVHEGWDKSRFDALFSEVAAKNTLLRSPLQAYESWIEDERVGGLQTGWEMFDRTVGKGIRRSDLVIPIARTNTGKTMMLLNMMQQMCMVPEQKDLKVMFYTLEQTGAQWFDRARKIWNFHNLDCEPEKVNEEAAAFWEPRLRLVEKNRVSEDEILISLDDYRTEMGDHPDVVFIDYLGYLSRGYQGSQTVDRVSAAAQSLKGIAKEINRPIVAPSQASRKAEHGAEVGLDDARDSGEIENTADIAIALWSQDTMKGKSSHDRTGELMTKLVKTRGPGKGKSLKFYFAPLTLVWVPEEAVRSVPMAKLEIGWDNEGDISWEEAIHAHRTGLPPKGRKGF